MKIMGSQGILIGSKLADDKNQSKDNTNTIDQKVGNFFTIESMTQRYL